jgi:hypothetical protein
MAFRSNMAKMRENPAGDSIREADGATSGASNQERGTSQSSKFRTVSTSTSLNVGNLVKVQGNTKDTGVVGRPSSVALEGKKQLEGATENPDGRGNRGGQFRP